MREAVQSSGRENGTETPDVWGFRPRFTLAVKILVRKQIVLKSSSLDNVGSDSELFIKCLSIKYCVSGILIDYSKSINFWSCFRDRK